MSIKVKELSDSLAKLFGVQHTIGLPTDEQMDKGIVFAVCGNGVFRVEKTPVAIFKSEVGGKITIPGLPDMSTEPVLLIPKIPIKYWQMVLTFFRDVYKKDKTEASVLFFWNHDNIELPEQKGLLVDGQLVIYCPKQVNESGLSEFKDDTFVNELRSKCTPLLEVHSHHTMGAFFSQTDDDHENMTQFYGVYGKINDSKPEFALRYVVGDKKVNISPEFLFDFPMVTRKTRIETFISEDAEPQVEEKVETFQYKGPWDRVEYPEEWMDQHTKKPYKVKVYKAGKKKKYGDYQYSGYQDYYYGNWSETGHYPVVSYGGSYHASEDYSSYSGSSYSKNDSDRIQDFLDTIVYKRDTQQAEENIRELIETLRDFGYEKEILFYLGRSE